VAQVKTQKRIGPGLAGPVRFVRIERASFSKKGNDFIEGPRVLAETISLDPQWRRFERTYYNADGSVLKMDVNTFDADGYQTESSGYDGEGNLIHKIVYVYDDRKKLTEYSTYKPDGTLLNRSIATRPVPGKVTEMVLFVGRRRSLANLMLTEIGLRRQNRSGTLKPVPSCQLESLIKS